MTAQLLPNLAYALLLLAALLTPYAGHFARLAGRRGDWAAWVILGAGLFLTFARGDAFPVFSVALLLPLLGLGWRALLGGIAAVLLFLPAMWWAPPAGASTGAMIVFAVLALIAAALPRLLPQKPGMQARRPALLPGLLICGGVGLVPGLLTAPFASAEPFYLAWHHWGAYLAPVEAWLSGGLPYRDFPVQYGLGPTAILAAACDTDCWRGAYVTVITANALYFALLGGCALLLAARRALGVRWLALSALFCASFAWTGLPASFGSAAATPSVAGLRFLPIAALLLHILAAERNGTRRDGIGHAIWFAAIFWSPEAAFFVTLLWWPWRAMREAGQAVDRGASPLPALLRGGAIGAMALGTALGLLGLTLWLLAGRAMTLDAFLAYIQHPPGPLPINPVGTLWVALAVILLAIVALARHGFSAHARMLYSCLLGLLGAGSYFLSRSHDNNVLNLFPLLLLVMLAVPGGQDDGPETGGGFVPAFFHTLLAAMIAFVALFNVTPWIEGAQRVGLLALGPQQMIDGFALKSGYLPQPLSPDAVAAVSFLRDHGAGQVVLLSDEKLMPWAPPGAGWTGVNNAANFVPLPEAMVRHYIGRGALAYHAPGWLVIDNDRYAGWAAWFRAAYDVREERQFGRYSAYHLVPRQPD